jgi:hypothetical protein
LLGSSIRHQHPNASAAEAAVVQWTQGCPCGPGYLLLLLLLVVVVVVVVLSGP